MNKRKKHSTPDRLSPKPGSSEPDSPEGADAGGHHAPGASPEVGHPELDIRLYDMRLEYEQARERAREKRLVEQIKEALVAAHAETARMSGLRPAGEPKPQPLTDREAKIFAVSERVKGNRQYCRELGVEGITPKRTGVWKDCPRTYLAAYDLGQPWRHRIEDEKAKIRHKAKLQKLAGELASE